MEMGTNSGAGAGRVEETGKISAAGFRHAGGRARPWVIAHRGDSFRAPENTLEAAERGWKAGAEAWELDVQLSRDGVPVVIHDPSLMRTTDVAKRFNGDPRAADLFRVADFDLEELKTLDAGGWFLDARGGPRSAVAFGTVDQIGRLDRERIQAGLVRLPTLAEALELTARLDWLVNIELKSPSADNPALINTVLDVIDATKTAGRVAISSFDHADVARVTSKRPEIATGVLTPNQLFRPAAYVREWVRADAYNPSTTAIGASSDRYRKAPSARALRTGDLEELQRAGVPVFVFTVNDARPDGLAVHLAEAGVAGVFTDDPRALRSLWPR
jgi:glycerophosphoryl diester phosphodiesterase